MRFLLNLSTEWDANFNHLTNKALQELFYRKEKQSNVWHGTTQQNNLLNGCINNQSMSASHSRINGDDVEIMIKEEQECFGS